MDAQELKSAPAPASTLEARLATAEKARESITGQPARLSSDLEFAELLLQSGNYKRAETQLASSLSTARELKLRRQEAHALRLLGHLNIVQGHWDQAQHALNQGLAIFELEKDEDGILRCLNNLAIVSLKAGEKETARALLERVVAMAGSLNNDHVRRLALQNLGYVYGELGNIPKAKELFEQALILQQNSTDELSEAHLHTNLGQLLLREGKFEEARPHLLLAAKLYLKLGSVRDQIIDLLGLAKVERLAQRLPESRGYLAETDTLMPRIQSPEDLQVRISQEKALLHAAGKDWEKAYEEELKHQRLARQEQERLAESKAQEAGLRLEHRLKDQELRLKTEEGNKLAAALKQSQSRLHMLWGAMGGLAVGMAALVYLFRAKLHAEQRSHDVTGLAKETAEASAALRMRLLRMAAHDLRSPLQVVSTSAELLSAEKDNPSLVSEYAMLVQGSARRMRELLEDLLSQAASDDGVLRVEPVPTEMQAYLAETVTFLRMPLQRKQQTLVLEARASAPLHALADPIRLWQVFENLVSNASKFSPPGVRITVILEGNGKFVRCGVRDCGPGISDADRVNLFRAFAKGSAKPTGGERSTGLGLSITKEIVELHGGRVTVDSALGRGSTFWIELPKAEATGSTEGKTPVL